MIQARHTIWAEHLFSLYLSRLLKRHFYGLSVLGEWPQTEANLPLLLLPNHSTWWDGFFVFMLNKQLFHRPAYLMMLEQELIRYRFFSRLGAFSINPQSFRGIKESLRYLVHALQQHSTPRPLGCIFPQGELLPWEARPLVYKRGLEVIFNMYGDKLNVLPLAIKTEFLQEQRPQTFFLFGKNQVFDHTSFPGMSWLQNLEEVLLAELTSRIIRGEQGMPLLRGRRSVHVRFTALIEKVRGMPKKTGSEN
ncbi:MAG: lysophospholipid acyltransferase family protein [candidate division KSB1 bacterium]|nr:lysophospholipid acyltransferase family protein [candidate division KSB1 bacterium]